MNILDLLRRLELNINVIAAVQYRSVNNSGSSVLAEETNTVEIGGSEKPSTYGVKFD